MTNKEAHPPLPASAATFGEPTGRRCLGRSSTTDSRHGMPLPEYPGQLRWAFEVVTVLALSVGVCALLLSFFTAPLGAQERAPQVFTCPDRIEGVSQELALQPEGWVAGRLGIPLWLAGITLFDGPIDENAALVPASERRFQGKVEERWDLDPRESRPLWLRCQYANTVITLSKPIGSGFRECIAVFDPQQRVAGQMVFEQMRCR